MIFFPMSFWEVGELSCSLMVSLLVCCLGLGRCCLRSLCWCKCSLAIVVTRFVGFGRRKECPEGGRQAWRSLSHGMQNLRRFLFPVVSLISCRRYSSAIAQGSNDGRLASAKILVGIEIQVFRTTISLHILSLPIKLISHITLVDLTKSTSSTSL